MLEVPNKPYLFDFVVFAAVSQFTQQEPSDI